MATGDSDRQAIVQQGPIAEASFRADTEILHELVERAETNEIVEPERIVMYSYLLERLRAVPVQGFFVIKGLYAFSFSVLNGLDHLQRLAKVIDVHDAAHIPYTPAVLDDWTGSADPGDLDDALDQLASRATVEEIEQANIAKFFQGTFVESFDALITSNGTTITMTLEQSGGGDLTMVFSDGYTTLDCTPALTKTLTEGADNAPKKQYVYILQSNKSLTVSDSGWPAAEHIRVSFFFLPSASLVNSGASGNNFVWVNHNINDPPAQTSGAGVEQGHLVHITERIRLDPAEWFSGCEGVATQDGNDLWVSIAAGLVFQMHPHTFDALDSDTASAGDTIGVTNHPNIDGFDAYRLINSLNEIERLSDGVAIANNKYVKFVLTGVANKTGALEHMLLSLPSGQYNTAAAAEADVQGFADFSSPREFLLDSSVGFLVASFVCKHTATAMEIVTTVDQRGKGPATATNAGTGGGDVTAATIISDLAVAVGDGGAKGIKGSSLAVSADDKLYRLGDTDTYLLFGDDDLRLFAGAREFLRLTEAASDHFYINPGQGDVDLRVGTPSNQAFLWIDANNERFGVNSGLAALFSVDARIDEIQCRLRGHSTQTNDILLIEQDDGTNILGVTETDLRLYQDNGKVLFGAGADAAIYYDGTNLVIDPAEVGSGYVDLNSGRLKGNSAAFGDQVDPSSAVILAAQATSQSDYTIAVNGLISYTGSSTSVRALNFTATHSGTATSPNAVGVNMGALINTDTGSGFPKAYGVLVSAGLHPSTTISQGTHEYYGGNFAIVSNANSHTGGTILAYALFCNNPPTYTGTGGFTYTSWCALFEGDVQLNTGANLILEGTSTTKGDSLLVYDSGGSTIDIQVSGTVVAGFHGTNGLNIEVGKCDAFGGFSDNGTDGIDGTFQDRNSNTVTVSGGIITDLGV